MLLLTTLIQYNSWKGVRPLELHSERSHSELKLNWKKLKSTEPVSNCLFQVSSINVANNKITLLTQCHWELTEAYYCENCKLLKGKNNFWDVLIEANRDKTHVSASRITMDETFKFSLCYLVHAPLPLVSRSWGLLVVLLVVLLLLHVAAVGQSLRAGWSSSTHSWRETLCAELHLWLAHEHTCSREQCLDLDWEWSGFLQDCSHFRVLKEHSWRATSVKDF